MFRPQMQKVEPEMGDVGLINLQKPWEIGLLTEAATMGCNHPVANLSMPSEIKIIKCLMVLITSNPPVTNYLKTGLDMIGWS